MAATRTSTPRRRRASDLLTVAVTGTSGTVGPALLERLTRSREVGRVVSVGRRRPDAQHGATPVEFREADVRDRAAVGRALDGADVVVHMAYALYGVTPGERDLFATNVEGTHNVARAAVAARARRFVYTSSAAVYGFRPDNPQPLSEDAPVRASARHFYSRHKAQAELLVGHALAGSGIDAYVFRPCAIVGPHAAGAAVGGLPRPAATAARMALGSIRRLGLPVAVAPPVPLQFVHEEDVAQAVALAAIGAGSPGVYNLAADDAVPGREVPELLGFRTLPLPRPVLDAALRLLTELPPVLPAVGWVETGTEPLLLDASKARAQLGWQPRYSSRAALRVTGAALAG